MFNGSCNYTVIILPEFDILGKDNTAGKGFIASQLHCIKLSNTINVKKRKSNIVIWVVIFESVT